MRKIIMISDSKKLSWVWNKTESDIILINLSHKIAENVKYIWESVASMDDEQIKEMKIKLLNSSASANFKAFALLIYETEIGIRERNDRGNKYATSNSKFYGVESN